MIEIREGDLLGLDPDIIVKLMETLDTNELYDIVESAAANLLTKMKYDLAIELLTDIFEVSDMYYDRFSEFAMDYTKKEMLKNLNGEEFHKLFKAMLSLYLKRHPNDD
jgi:hypothetical protein